MKRPSPTILRALAVCAGAATQLHAQTTAFTYQEIDDLKQRLARIEKLISQANDNQDSTHR